MDADEDGLEELNVFLRTHKVLSVEKVPVVVQGRQYWSFCVEYLERAAGARDSARGAQNAGNNKPRTDYREILTEAQFKRFSKLRQLRKQISESAALPVYTLFTNAQLAEIARVVPRTKSALLAIEGLGDARLARHGEALLELIATFDGPEANEATGGVGAIGFTTPEASLEAEGAPE